MPIYTSVGTKALPRSAAFYDAIFAMPGQPRLSIGAKA